MMKFPYPSTAEGAAQMLMELAEKDKDESLCYFPRCDQQRRVLDSSGQPPKFCGHPDHTSVNRIRIIEKLQKIVGNVPRNAKDTQLTDPDSPQSAHTQIVRSVIQLQTELEQYKEYLEKSADPEAVNAAIQSALKDAELKVAGAEKVASEEHVLRVAAEEANAQAQRKLQDLQEATQEAIARMEQAESDFEQLQQETGQRIAEMEAKQEKAIIAVRQEAQRQIDEMRENLQRATWQATEAQEKEKQALNHASRVEELSEAKVTAAEGRVTELLEQLRRERTAADQQKQEYAQILKEERQRGTQDRQNHEKALVQERSERERLQQELIRLQNVADIATKRADALFNELHAQMTKASEQQPKS